MTCLKFYLDENAKAVGVTFQSPKPGDAGFDLRAIENCTIAVGEQVTVSTGLRLAIPEGWVGLVKDRSSMGAKCIYTHGGVIDSGYRGELRVLLSNRGTASYSISAGDKIAQLVVVPCLVEGLECSSEQELGETVRGEKGFGSSGR